MSPLLTHNSGNNGLDDLDTDPGREAMKTALRASVNGGVVDAALLTHLAGAVREAQAEAAVARRALARAQRRLDATLRHAPVGIAHVLPDGRFAFVNEHFARICGHSRAALMDNGFQRITHPDDLDVDLAHVDRLLSGAADSYVMEKRYVRPDGGIVWVNLTVALVRDEDGAPDFFVSVIEDLSEIRKAHADAMRDPLTGLINRRGFIDRTAREIARSAIAGLPLALAYLDLDGFKPINDRRGHPEGDACLTAVAKLLERTTRPGDVVARLGGDEFAILMPGLGTGNVVAVVDRIRVALTEMGIERNWGVSGSFGVVARVPQGDLVPAQLIADADTAMFAAKRAGKNRVVLA